MNLFSGLEKFGLDVTKGKNLFEDETDRGGKGSAQAAATAVHIPTEDEFLLDKKVNCRVCDADFQTKVVKNSRIRRLEPDKDLRPRFQYIDTLKYDVTSCPYCGYTAMNRYFEHITSAQAKLVREGITARFHGGKPSEESTYSYDQAIERYKLSLMNTVVKRGKTSERAYNCLKIAWLLRAKAEEIQKIGGETEAGQAAVATCKAEEEEFYRQAYEGFQLAMAKESFPMCGMEPSTVDYLMACMSIHFGEYSNASRYLSSVLTSQSSSRRMKDLALDLKEEVVAGLRKNAQQ